MLEVGERSDEWPAFVMAATADGRRGWVPARILRVDGSMGHARKGFDTTSLDPEVGEELEVVTEDVEGGWLWCRDSHARAGWFPKSHLEVSDGTPK
jgi:hypothetical protein